MGTPDNAINGSFTITAKQLDNGLLVSLASEGSYSDETFTRKFYSIPELPPPDVTPHQFWAVLMRDIAGFFDNPE